MLRKIFLSCFFITIICASECVHCYSYTSQNTAQVCCSKDESHVLCASCYENRRKIKLTECPICKAAIFYKTNWYSQSLLEFVGMENISLEEIRAHLKGKPIVPVEDEDGTTVVLQLCYNTNTSFENKSKILSFLIRSGFSINRANLVGDSPISVSVANRDMEMTKLLLSKGADPNVKRTRSGSCFGNKRPMTEAVTNNDTEIMSVLHANGAKFLVEDLEWAYFKKSLAAAKLIMDNVKIDTDKKGLFGRTLLMWAAESGDRCLLERTLSFPGINLKEKDDEGKTAFDLASTDELKSLVLPPAKEVLPIEKHINKRTFIKRAYAPMVNTVFFS